VRAWSAAKLVLKLTCSQSMDLVLSHPRRVVPARKKRHHVTPDQLGLSPMRTKQEILKTHAEECSRRAGLVTDPLIRHNFLDLAAQWLELVTLHRELEAEHEKVNGSYRASGSKPVPEILIKRDSWRRGQRRAFDKAMMDEALETTLGVLIPTVSDVIGGGVRAAFYLANPAGTALHHVVGMPAAYAEAVDGFKIGPTPWRAG
jgi:hypothetical protein